MVLHCGCSHQCVLYLGRTETMAADIDDVIHSPSYLVVSIFRAERSITSEITPWERTSADNLQQWRQSVSKQTSLTWIRCEIRLNESLVVTINTPGHPRPWLTDAQSTANRVSIQAFALKTTRSHKAIRHYCNYDQCLTALGRLHGVVLCLALAVISCFMFGSGLQLNGSNQICPRGNALIILFSERIGETSISTENEP